MNDNINEEMKKIEGVKVINNDLLYQDAVLEFIDNNENIDYILINENLPGEPIEDFIKKISKIKTIIFVEKYEKNAKILIENGAFKVYENGKITIEEIVKIIKKEDETELLKKEIENLKQIIFEQEKKEVTIIEKIKQIKLNILKIKQIKDECKIISIVGLNERENAIFSINLAKEINKKRKKTLIIDLDILNNNIEYFENKKIIKKGKYLDIINGKRLLLDIHERRVFDEEINKLRQKYEYLIFNTNMKSFLDKMQNITSKASRTILILDNKDNRKNILKILIENWNVDESLLEIIVSRTSEKIYYKKDIKNIILENEIIEKNSYVSNYTIDKDSFSKIKIKYPRKDYKKIFK